MRRPPEPGLRGGDDDCGALRAAGGRRSQSEGNADQRNGSGARAGADNLGVAGVKQDFLARGFAFQLDPSASQSGAIQ